MKSAVIFYRTARARNYPSHVGHGLAGRVGEKIIPLLDFVGSLPFRELNRFCICFIAND